MTRQPLDGRSAYSHFTRITTRWHDNDAYGHVNNVVYYSWFDTAVNAWLIEVGLLDIERGNPIGLVVETNCRYAASVQFPAEVEVGLCIVRLGVSSVTYQLGVFLIDTDDAAAEGRFTHVYVDRHSRRPTPLPPHWRETLQTIAR